MEITFHEAKGYLREIDDDVYERVDEAGNLLGYTVLNVSHHERSKVTIPIERGRFARLAQVL